MIEWHQTCLLPRVWLLLLLSSGHWGELVLESVIGFQEKLRLRSCNLGSWLPPKARLLFPRRGCRGDRTANMYRVSDSANNSVNFGNSWGSYALPCACCCHYRFLSKFSAVQLDIHYGWLNSPGCGRFTKQFFFCIFDISRMNSSGDDRVSQRNTLAISQHMMRKSHIPTHLFFSPAILSFFLQYQPWHIPDDN